MKVIIELAKNARVCGACGRKANFVVEDGGIFDKTDIYELMFMKHSIGLCKECMSAVVVEMRKVIG